MEFRLHLTAWHNLSCRIDFLDKKHTIANQMLTTPPHSDLSLSLYHSVLTGNSFRSTRTTFKSQFATQPRFRSPPFELIKCTMSLLFGGAYFKILEVSMIQTYPNVSNGFPVFSKAALRFIFLRPESTFPLMVSRKASTSEAKTHQ